MSATQPIAVIATAMQVPTSAVRLATRTPPKEKWS